MKGIGAAVVFPLSLTLINLLVTGALVLVASQ